MFKPLRPKLGNSMNDHWKKALHITDTQARYLAFVQCQLERIMKPTVLDRKAPCRHVRQVLRHQSRDLVEQLGSPCQIFPGGAVSPRKNSSSSSQPASSSRTPRLLWSSSADVLLTDGVETSRRNISSGLGSMDRSFESVCNLDSSESRCSSLAHNTIMIS